MPEDSDKTRWMVCADSEWIGVADSYEAASKALKDAYAKDMGLTQEEREALFLDLKFGDWRLVDPKFSSIYRKADYYITEVPRIV